MSQMKALLRFRELDPLGWESPSDFNSDAYESSLTRIKALKPEIEQIISHRMTLDTSIQDASYFAELAWLSGKHYTHGVGGALVAKVAVRFSNFDRMATVYSDNEDEKGLLRFEPQFSAILTKHGFQYVPHAALMEPYPGNQLRTGRAWKHRNWQGWTWFTRFFDHI